MSTNTKTIDYQIPVTQLKGPKGNGDMQDLSVMGVRVGVANFFWVN